MIVPGSMLMETVGSSAECGGFEACLGCGCIRRSIAPRGSGNQGEVMTAGQALLISVLRRHERLRRSCRPSLARCQRRRPGLRHVPAGVRVGGRGPAGAGGWRADATGGCRSQSCLSPDKPELSIASWDCELEESLMPCGYK
jgi:hypothetical protein